jgi:hypothetical protein
MAQAYLLPKLSSVVLVIVVAVFCILFSGHCVNVSKFSAGRTNLFFIFVCFYFSCNKFTTKIVQECLACGHSDFFDIYLDQKSSDAREATIVFPVLTRCLQYSNIIKSLKSRFSICSLCSIYIRLFIQHNRPIRYQQAMLHVVICSIIIYHLHTIDMRT